ncbi:MAG TPA: hypothetical protein PLS70_23405, partial [Acidobacteriota bacterium]|nr:hypothetical protein [Acidobacteriota bacterium]
TSLDFQLSAFTFRRNSLKQLFMMLVPITLGNFPWAIFQFQSEKFFKLRITGHYLLFHSKTVIYQVIASSIRNSQINQPFENSGSLKIMQA